MTYTARMVGILLLSCFSCAGGCSKSSTFPFGQGNIRLVLINSPASFDHANIDVLKVDVLASGSDSTVGWITVSPSPTTYDLADLTTGVTRILGDAALPAGKYGHIRLTIGRGSHVVIRGVSYVLEVSRATGFILTYDFEIEEGKALLLTLACDGTQSITFINGNYYKLYPVIRVVSNPVAGAISGINNPLVVSSAILTVPQNVNINSVNMIK